MMMMFMKKERTKRRREKKGEETDAKLTSSNAQAYISYLNGVLMMEYLKLVTATALSRIGQRRVLRARYSFMCWPCLR